MPVFLAAIFILQAFLFAAHWAIYATIVIFFAIKNHAAIVWLGILATLLSALFTIASVISHKFDNFFSRLFYRIAAVWTGMFFCYLFAALFTWIAYFYNSTLGRGAIDMDNMAGVLFILATVVGIYGIINGFIIRKREIRIELKNLPEAWRRKKALWVSDVHLGAIHNLGFARKVARAIGDLGPAVIFIGGDLFDGVKVKDAHALARPFAELNAEHGIYFIPGNHEVYGNEKEFLETVKKSGINILRNEKIEIEGLQIIGADYSSNKRAEEFARNLQSLNIEKNKPSILLKHVPDNLQVAQEAGINFQISGHTHKGQAIPFSWIAQWVFKKYAYGLRRFKNMLVYVSSGVGTWGPPFRIGSKPEIILISFEEKTIS